MTESSAMMDTPSLSRRIITAGVAVIAVLLLSVNTFVYFSLQGGLENAQEEILTGQSEIARALGEQIADTEQLAEVLSEFGVSAIVRDAEGQEYLTRRMVGGEPDPAFREPFDSKMVDVGGDRTVEVLASRADTDRTLNRMRLVAAIATLFAIGLGAAGLLWAARYSLEPIEEVVATARRTASGQTGARLNPTRTDTELGKMATAFDEMLDTLESALDESRATEARVRRFLADAAHHLRTPVAGIHGAAEMMLRSNDEHDRDRLVSLLLRETGRTTKLVGALMRIARLDKGEPPERQPTNLVELVRDEVEKSELVAPHLTHNVSADATLEKPLLLDPEAVRELIWSLLDNARRHAATRIDVEIRQDKLEAEVRVDDDGLGLADDFVDWAFERFVSLDGQGGSGLGLPLARAIARAHAGDLVYRDGQFVFRFPMRRRMEVVTEKDSVQPIDKAETDGLAESVTEDTTA